MGMCFYDTSANARFSRSFFHSKPSARVSPCRGVKHTHTHTHSQPLVQVIFSHCHCYHYSHSYANACEAILCVLVRTAKEIAISLLRRPALGQTASTRGRGAWAVTTYRDQYTPINTQTVRSQSVQLIHMCINDSHSKIIRCVWR